MNISKIDAWIDSILWLGNFRFDLAACLEILAFLFMCTQLILLIIEMMKYDRRNKNFSTKQNFSYPISKTRWMVYTKFYFNWIYTTIYETIHKTKASI